MRHAMKSINKASEIGNALQLPSDQKSSRKVQVASSNKRAEKSTDFPVKKGWEHMEIMQR